jgi:hypothetical protein
MYICICIYVYVYISVCVYVCVCVFRASELDRESTMLKLLVPAAVLCGLKLLCIRP